MILIIGAGYTGLSLAYHLAKKGKEVMIIDKLDKAGGLAVGFKAKNWKWSLENHYHHWFTNDSEILRLAKKIKCPVVTVRPKTSTFIENKIYQLDSAKSLLLFSKLSLIDRIRSGMIIAFLKISPFLTVYEKVTSCEFLTKSMGSKSWKILWEPLYFKKFGRKNYKKISMSWFWARIKKRTQSLSYPKGGFQNFTDILVKYTKELGVKYSFNESFESYKKVGNNFKVKTSKRNINVDKIVFTSPVKNSKIKMIGAINLILELNKKFLPNKTYWLNINDLNFPFLALVEHTNFMKSKYYGNKSILYIGNYLDKKDLLFNKTSKELLNIFYPYLKKINPNFDKSDIKSMYLSKSEYAQPIVDKNYSKNIPNFKTDINDIFLANMQQVYPWDRGTNYAIEIGRKVSELI